MIHDQQGFSLLENLLVILVIGAIIILIANLPNAAGLITKSSHLSLGREIAVSEIENKRMENYVNLVNDTTPLTDSRMSLLPHGKGTVTVEDCDITICTSSEHVKKVTVSVSWKDNNKQQNVNLTTFIGEGGLNQ